MAHVAATASPDRIIAAEHVLLHSGVVTDCVVLARRTTGGATRMVAYVVSRPQVPFSAGELRAIAERSLPRDRVPDLFVELRSIPLTSSGQVDVPRILDIEVVDQRVQEAWEQCLRDTHGVEDVAVVVEDVTSARAVLHLSDLVPGWTGGNAPVDTSPLADMPVESGAPASSRPAAFADGGALDL